MDHLHHMYMYVAECQSIAISYVVLSQKVYECFFCWCSVEKEEIVLHWTEMGETHSKTQMELADGAKAGNEEDTKNLNYFTAQLQLFCNMCFNRQYLAILKIKEMLPIDIVLQ